MNSPRKGDFLMFTGIITNLGKLKKKNGSVFIFEADRKFCRKLGSGASVAVNGTCLTIFEKPTLTSFSVELMPETLNRTMFKHIKLNEPVNLELPLSPSSFFSIHLFTYHFFINFSKYFAKISVSMLTKLPILIVLSMVFVQV